MSNSDQPRVKIRCGDEPTYQAVLELLSEWKVPNTSYGKRLSISCEPLAPELHRQIVAMNVSIGTDSRYSLDGLV